MTKILGSEATIASSRSRIESATVASEVTRATLISARPCSLAKSVSAADTGNRDLMRSLSPRMIDRFVFSERHSGILNTQRACA